MDRFKRVLILVLDGVGIGELPDAGTFGDEGSNTLGNTVRAMGGPAGGGLDLPNLQRLGLGNISPGIGIPLVDAPLAHFGRMAEISAGKDTTVGHWELMGLPQEKPFPTFPEGFPAPVLDEFEQKIGRKSLGNYAASGTVIIEELGREHLDTGKPIVYTSADSVFQIAAHEDVIPVPELYRICATARGMLTGEYGVARVIARPFVGELGSFQRTANRRDFSLPPPGKTLLDLVAESGRDVIGVGKIEDIFSRRGITRSKHTGDNADTTGAVLEFMKEDWAGLLLANLNDFDSKYGHRNNVEGFAGALLEFDRSLPDILAKLRDGDMLVLTADHGNDPTTPSTDHSREYVPLLLYWKGIPAGQPLGTRKTFADLAATAARALGIEYGLAGGSLLT
jgi:phosphopentomutase